VRDVEGVEMHEEEKKYICQRRKVGEVYEVECKEKGKEES